MDQNDINRLRGKTAVVGLAESGCGLASGWSAMEIMASAVHDALDDAGIKLKEVDGVFAATAFHSMAAMSLSEYLGVKPKFADGSQIGGSSFLSHILTAAMALDAGLQCVPGSGRVSATNRETLLKAKEIGYPVMIKAAAGGGGRGISIVHEENDLIPKMRLTQQEALNSFGSDEIYLEKFLDSPRHIEVQVLADNFGNALHFYERDCSIQRKNQKIVEEAPALNIPEEKKQELFKLCTECCKKMKYKGAGTFEFLYKDEEFYFIEMNTRLQVEHTVSEMITNYDLVKLQIGIAAGEELKIKQKEISVCGHAIQCRINAEHPKTFIPSPGKITEWGKPGGIGVRVDSHVYDGCIISPYYDALIAKICTQGKDREEALCRMSFALEEFFVEGIDTNKELQELILNEENFRKANISINYLERVLDIN